MYLHQPIGKSPCDIGSHTRYVLPQPGSIVCCSIYEAFDHTGIWVEGDVIVELHGSGLIKALSPNRFLEGRSGENIFVACDDYGSPIIFDGLSEHAVNKIYSYEEYDVIKNNCHQFVWRCISQSTQTLTTFTSLNEKIASVVKHQINWHPIKAT